MLRHIWERLPGLWVGLPVLGACLVAVAVGNNSGPLAGVGAGIAIGLLAALVIERPLRALASVAAKIAAGDRYAIVPKQPRGPLSELAEAAQSLRMAVVEADTLMVDQRRREAEARLHYAGRSFFTRRFRGAVDEVVNAFTAGSQRIGTTAADLAHRNRHMHVKVATAADAAQAASADVAVVADVNGSVGHITDTSSNLRQVLEHQTAELDAIASRASSVAGQIVSALPEIKSAVGHVDQAGQSAKAW